MPFYYEIDPQRKLVTLTFAGDVSVRDVTDGRARALADARFFPEFALLVDLCEADLRPVPAQTVRDRARHPPPVARIAVLTPPHGVAYGLARMYELTSTANVQVFTDRKEAEAWLAEAFFPGTSAPPR